MAAGVTNVLTFPIISNGKEKEDDGEDCYRNVSNRSYSDLFIWDNARFVNSRSEAFCTITRVIFLNWQHHKTFVQELT
ncbi:hypothetical protein F0562_013281 [Nyssa sinensis]|uniref:Uncharacterized protein n=1 Tax=Nyssa sinensis TaxID=561372 RepID=A0A5J4ZXD0_9ASTE|nr:hypothetical protein F0562_013281 [Nyssa sinensis]